MKKYYTQITFFFIIAILIGVSFLTYRNLSNYIEEVRWIRNSNRILRTLEMTLSSIKDAETGHRGYQLTSDSTFLKPYEMAVNEIPKLVATLDSLFSDNKSQLERVDSLKVLINVQLLLIPQILSNTNRSSLHMDTFEKNLLFRSKENTDAIRSQTKKILDAETEIFNARVKREQVFRNVAPAAILLYALIAIGCAVILFYRILEALRSREHAERELAENVNTLKNEVAVREFTQTLLRNVLDNSLNGIMAYKSIRNADNEIIDFEGILANTTSLKMTEKKEEEIVGKSLLHVFPGIKAHGLFDLYKQTVTSGVPMHMETYTREGLEKYFYVSAVKLEDGFVVTYSDITEQKQQIVLVKERELLLKEAEVLANMGSWKWTANGNHMVWSDGLSRILGNVSEEKRSWNTFIDCAHVEDKEILEQFIANAMNKLEGFRMEYRCIVNDSIRHFYISVTAETEIEKGNILGVVVDITELKLKEKQLEQINIDLNRSNQDLEQFAYVASHDLQEPLRKIRAFGDLLITKYAAKVDETGVDYIGRMQSAASRMQILIQDLLSFSRVSRNSSRPEGIDMNVLVGEVIEDLEDQIKREGAIIKVDEFSFIKGDKVQLRRLFQNLITNAIKFHKADEKPLIRIKAATLTNENQIRYFPSAQSDTKYVMFTVEDNGIGFDQQYADKIFNIFQRLNGRMDYEGTGIGLAICRKIVTNHQGIITAESNENIGSKFIVILPSN